MKNLKVLFIFFYLFSYTTQIAGLDIWVVTNGNEELPFQIKSEYPDGTGNIYLYSINGQILQAIKKVKFIGGRESIFVFFDDGDQVQYKIIQPEIRKKLVVDKDNKVFVLIKRQVFLFKPSWALYRFNSDYPLMVFQNVVTNEQESQFYATLSSGEVIQYNITESHLIPPMVDIPDIGDCLAAHSPQ